MEQEYETKEVWYPYSGGGEMREIPYSCLRDMPNSVKDSKIVPTDNSKLASIIED